jgi:hypothetical protein
MSTLAKERTKIIKQPFWTAPPVLKKKAQVFFTFLELLNPPL